ncbi:GntR family transcriptional regulator [Sphingomonas sp. R86520]|uniref:GntR family transcriptional regulator n=1 Tax=Sphingomonas sp. R86520 TaxID=3093859 RepID=UPI0036D37E01
MNSAPTFDRAYARIRGRVLTGWWRPGERIDLAVLADDLGASITPVRDALYRLVGERLVALGVSEGFAVPSLTEPDLRDRYRWNQMLVLLALGSLDKPPQKLLVALPDPADLETRAARAFRTIAKETGQSDMLAAVESVSDRLAHARIAEASLGIATLDDITALLHAIDKGTPAVRRAEIIRYHRRRMQQCGRIVAAMHRGKT